MFRKRLTMLTIAGTLFPAFFLAAGCTREKKVYVERHGPPVVEHDRVIVREHDDRHYDHHDRDYDHR